MFNIQPNSLYSVSLIYFFWAATAFDIFGTDNAEELLTCGFQYPCPPPCSTPDVPLLSTPLIVNADSRLVVASSHEV